MSFKSLNLNHANTPTSTFAIENPDSCEIHVIKCIAHGVNTETKEEHMIFEIEFRTQFEKKTKQVVVNRFTSKGQASLMLLNSVIKIIDGVDFKNISIYYNNDYAVNTYNNMNLLLSKGRVEVSPNKEQILEMSDLKKTVGNRHYICVRKEKVVKVYGKKCHE